ncbi:MAG: flagellar basal body rod protein FlgG, partial [Candidatus Kapabacteria bacterium]|nr:flagellar basal body rod protein FlgG [Candidatus Kapabacteria bacterium]
NVDLTEQFADLISTQRAFEAAARTITVSDQMLQEITSLKR